MRDPKRISKILKKIEKIWKKNPDLRFNQLIISINYNCGMDESNYWNLEDDMFEECLEQWEQRHGK